MAMTARALGAVHDTTDGTGAKTTGSFTPNQGERIYLLSTAANGSDASGFTYTVSGGQVLGTSSTAWTRRASLGTTRFTQVHEASYTALDRSMTVSITPGTSITGMNLSAVGITGFPSVRQVKTANGTSGVAPSVTFDSAVAAGSLVLACCYVSVNPSALVAPTGFTTLNDSGYNTPNGAQQVVVDESGFSGSAVTWGSTATTSWNVVALELEEAGIEQMSHFIRYGADSTYQVLRIQYPTADPDNRTAGFSLFPILYSGAHNQWGAAGGDFPPTTNVYADCLTRGVAGVYVQFRKQPTNVYDDQLRDIHSAIAWVISNASTYKLDTTRVGAFSISAGAHLWASAALTATQSDVGGASTPKGHIRHVLWHFGHNRPRLVDPAFTALGITRSITNCCDGSGTSVEAVMLGGVPCSLASFDWVAADGGSLSTATTAVYNKFTPGFWASQYGSGTKTTFELWHGDADDSIPYFCTHNPKTLGTGHALDNGLHEDLVANGFISSYVILPGEGHGGNAFQPSSNVSATNGAAVDASIVRLLDAMGAGGDSQQDRRRRGYSLLFHNHGLPNRRSV